MAENLDKELGFEEEENEFGFKAEEETLPEVSQLEAAAKGLAEGGTLGFSDELSAALGAGSEALAGITGEPGFEPHPGESRIDQLKRTYEQYRDEERKRQKASMEQHPGTFLGAGLAGGLALPLKGPKLAKDASMLTKMAREAAMGAGTGAVAGAGISEAETPGELLQDVGEMGGAGALLGGSIPMLATAGKKTAAAVKGSDSFKDLMEAYQRGKAGQVLTGSEGRQKATEMIGEFSGRTQKALTDRAKLFGQAKDKALKRSKDTVDLSATFDQYRKMIAAAKQKTSDPTARAEYEKLEKILDMRQKGQKSISQVVEEAPDIHPDTKKLIDKRDTMATKSEQNEKFMKGYNQMLRKKALAEDKGITFTDDVQFYTNEEGKGVFNLIGKDHKGQTKRFSTVIDDSPIPTSRQKGQQARLADTPEGQVTGTTGNITEVQEFVGKDGQKYATFVDKSTGKVYTKRLTDLTPKEKKVTEFIGGKEELSATELDNLRKDLQRYTGVSDEAFKDPRAQKVALNMVRDLGETIKTVTPGYERINRGYSNVKNVVRDLGLEDVQSVDDVMREISQDIDKLTADSMTGYTERYIFKRFKERLQQTDPELAHQIIPEMEEVLRRTELSFQTATPGIVAGPSGAPTVRTGVEGIPTAIGNLAGRGVQAITKDVSKTPGASLVTKYTKMSADKLSSLAQKYAKSDKPSHQNLANVLFGMADKSERARNSLMFGLLQNPAYREILEREE